MFLVVIRTISSGREVVRVQKGGEISVVLKMETFFSRPGLTHLFDAEINNQRGC